MGFVTCDWQVNMCPNDFCVRTSAVSDELWSIMGKEVSYSSIIYTIHLYEKKIVYALM